MIKKNDIKIKDLIINGLLKLVSPKTSDPQKEAEDPRIILAWGFIEDIAKYTKEIYLSLKTEKGIKSYGYQIEWNTNNQKTKDDINLFFNSPYYPFVLKTILDIIDKKNELDQREKAIEQKEKSLAKKKRSGTSIISRGLADQILNHKKLITKESGKLDGSLVKLNKYELKVIWGIIEILNDQSSTDFKNEDSFTGLSFTTNKDGFKYPEVYVSLYEIAKKIIKQENPGGKDINQIEKAINDLSTLPEKRFSIKWEVKKYDKNTKENSTYEFTQKSHLFEKLDIEEFVLKNNVKESQGKAIVLSLHNIWINQIQNNFIEIPKIKDVIQIADTADISDIIQNFVWEISYAHSNRKFLKSGNSRIYKINQKSLFEKIAPKYMESRQRTLIIPYFLKGLDMAKGLGMVTDFKETKNKTGDLLYNFYISEGGWIPDKEATA